MKIRPVVYTFFTIAVISMILWLIDRFFQSFLPEYLKLSFLILSLSATVIGFSIGINFEMFYFRYESDKRFTLLDRLLDGMNGELLGEIQVDSKTDKIYEVFYRKPYMRPPSLKIRQRAGSYEFIEQRSDGFKIKGHDIYDRIWWKTKGEFADITKSDKTSSLSFSIFGSPNKKYTYGLFVLMPFTSSLKPVYDDHIKKVAKTQNLSIARADDFFSQNSIMYEVWSAIAQASILIADCTGKNPNVFYEIGIAHTIGKPVILITQNQDDVPFDLRHIRYIHYEYTPSGMIKFENTLTTTISEIMKDISTGKQK